MSEINVESLDVVQYPHPALRWVSKTISKITPLVQDVAKKMISLMHEYKGIGLAANQIGLPWRMFVTCLDKERVFINPKITLIKGKKIICPDEPEACLSIAGLNFDFPIKRDLAIQVEAQDIDGNEFVLDKDDLKKNNYILARCVQHEFDHLNGILFVDHIPREQLVPEHKQYLDGWLNYMEVQYNFLLSHGKLALNRFEDDDKEKAKLLNLEQLITA